MNEGNEHRKNKRFLHYDTFSIIDDCLLNNEMNCPRGERRVDIRVMSGHDFLLCALVLSR